MPVFQDFSLVELELKTGRTHQIRVHMSHLGYPLVGDDMYGGRRLTVGDVTGPAGQGDRSPRDSLMPRQALHAALLGFTHPMTNEPMTFEAPLPNDLLDLVTLLRDCRFVKAPNVAGSMLDLDQVIP